MKFNFKHSFVLAALVVFSNRVHAQNFDVPALCKEMGKAIIAGEFRNISQPLLNEGKAEDILKAIRMAPNSTTVWMLLMSPNSEARYAAVMLQAETMRQWSQLDVSQIVAAAKAPAPPYSNDELTVIRQRFALLRQSTRFDQEISTLKTILPGVCLEYGNAGCGASAKLQAEIMHPRVLNSTAFSMIDVLENVLTDSRYVQGIARAAQSALALVERSRKGEKVKAEILSLLIDSYQNETTSKEEATERAWSTLAVYGSIGASVAPRAENFSGVLAQSGSARAVWASMHMLFASIDYLNSVSAPMNGFGYDPTIDTGCSYGKAYRFWMAAYLAREATKQGHSPKSAALSSYLLAMFYEMNSTTYRRNPDSIFYQPHLSVGSHGARINIAFSAAGAEFGATANHPHAIHLDEAILAEMKAAKPHGLSEPELSQALQNMARRYSIWKKIVAPDEAYRAVNGGR